MILKTAAVLAVFTVQARASCNPVALDFIMLEDDSLHAAIEDDIRADLARANISVVARTMDKDDLNANMTSGTFDLVFSETWGAPCKC